MKALFLPLCGLLLFQAPLLAQNTVDLRGTSGTTVYSPSLENKTPAGQAPGHPITSQPDPPQSSPAPIADPDYRGADNSQGNGVYVGSGEGPVTIPE